MDENTDIMAELLEMAQESAKSSRFDGVYDCIVSQTDSTLQLYSCTTHEIMELDQSEFLEEIGCAGTTYLEPDVTLPYSQYWAKELSSKGFRGITKIAPNRVNMSGLRRLLASAGFPTSAFFGFNYIPTCMGLGITYLEFDKPCRQPKLEYRVVNGETEYILYDGKEEKLRVRGLGTPTPSIRPTYGRAKLIDDERYRQLRRMFVVQHVQP